MHSALFVSLVAFPWVLPMAYGPAPSVAVWLVSCAALAGITLVFAFRRPPPQRMARNAQNTATAWALAALVSALLAVLQYAGAVTSADSPFAPWITPAQLGEAYANLRQRNHFATLTNLGLAALLWWQAVGQSYSGPHSKLQGQSGTPPNTVAGQLPARATVVVCALAAVLAVGNAASGSRTGLLQLLFLGACTWVWRSKDLPQLHTARLQTWLLAVCTYAMAAVLLPAMVGLDPQSSGILARLQDAQAGCQSRRVLWSNVLHLIAQRPWLGWGWGELDYAHFTTLYPGPRFCDILDNAHNLPLQLAVELGVPCAVAACAALVWWTVRHKPWQESHPTRQLAWAVLALVGLHSLLEYPLWYGPFQMAVLLAMFLLWQTPARAAAQSRSGPVVGPVGRRIAVGAALATLVFCAYAAWDYWRISQIYTNPPQRAAAYREDTLQKLQASWLFSDYVQFAELTTTPLSGHNAERMHSLAVEMLHFSPEPRVVRLAIKSARLLGYEAQAAYYLQRFQAAFPHETL